MSEQFSIKDITQDLSFLLTLTKLFEADEQGFWRDVGTRERYIHKLDSADEGKPIVIFQDPFPEGDFYFFNPYSEGFGKQSPSVALFFKLTRKALNLNIERSVLYVAEQVLLHKKMVEEKQDHRLGPTIIRMSSVAIDKKNTLIDVIDDTMLEEFEEIFEVLDGEFIFVPYMTAQMTSTVKIDILTEPAFEEKISKDIRKKSFAAFKALMMGILGIKSPEELSEFASKYDPKTKSSARLQTTLSVYLNLYMKFNDVLADAFNIDGEPRESEVIDLGHLQTVIERTPLAYAIAKHMIQPVIPRQSAVSTTTIDTRGVSSPGGGSGVSIIPDPFKPEVVPNIGWGASNQPTHRSPFEPEVVSPGFNLPPAAGSLPMSRGHGGMYGNPYGGYPGFPNQGIRIPINAGGQINIVPPSNFDTPFTRRNW